MLRWRKSWTLENLQGSIRKDLEPSERSVWSDLLDLCGLSRRWGIIERSEGIPYTNEDYAHMFITPLAIVVATIEKCVREGRLQRNGDGTLIVTHWEKYQASKAKKEQQASDVPLDRDDKEKAGELAATKLGYLHPKSAEKGIQRRQAEEAIKKTSTEKG